MILLTVAFGMAGAMAFVAILCWRRTAMVQALLSDSIGMTESIKQRAYQIEKDRQKLTDRIEQQKEMILRYEKQIGAKKTKQESDLKRLEERAQAAEELSRQQELRLDHLRAQVEVLNRQIKEADAAAKEAQQQAAYVSQNAHKKWETERTRLSKELLDAEQTVANLREKLELSISETARLRKSAAEFDQARFKDLERRVHHYEHLYKAMRGLREMADERNRNWELGLRKLSRWILLANKRRAIEVDQLAIGPLVGEAMHLIGESLIDDEFGITESTHADAKLALVKAESKTNPTREKPVSV